MSKYKVIKSHLHINSLKKTYKSRHQSEIDRFIEEVSDNGGDIKDIKTDWSQDGNGVLYQFHTTIQYTSEPQRKEYNEFKDKVRARINGDGHKETKMSRIGLEYGFEEYEPKEGDIMIWDGEKSKWVSHEPKQGVNISNSRFKKLLEENEAQTKALQDIAKTLNDIHRRHN